MKINPSNIVRDHLGTLRNDRTGRTSVGDLLIFYGLPAAALVVGFVTCFQVGKEAYNLSVTFFGIFIALLLNIQVAIFAILQRKRDEPNDERLKAIHQRNLQERRALLAELNANISYLVLFCCLALVAFLALFVLDPRGRLTCPPPVPRSL